MTAYDIADYHRSATTIPVRLDDHMVNLSPKQFSSGNLGWYGNSKIKLLVGETYYPCQVSLIVTIIGSRNSASPSAALAAQEATPATFLADNASEKTSRQDGAVLGQERASGDQSSTSANHKAVKRNRKGKGTS